MYFNHPLFGPDGRPFNMGQDLMGPEQFPGYFQPSGYGASGEGWAAQVGGGGVDPYSSPPDGPFPPMPGQHPHIPPRMPIRSQPFPFPRPPMRNQPMPGMPRPPIRDFVGGGWPKGMPRPHPFKPTMGPRGGRSMDPGFRPNPKLEGLIKSIMGKQGSTPKINRAFGR